MRRWATPVGLVYLSGFATLINQGLPLLGSRGILPIGEFTVRVTERLGSASAGFKRLPSLFWFAHSDALLLGLAWCGALLAVLVMFGMTNAAAPLCCFTTVSAPCATPRSPSC